jgi:hypothetical protein
MSPMSPEPMITPMWAVMTKGDVPSEREYRGHAETVAAWDDYANRILDLETHGYTRGEEKAALYGRRWSCELHRGNERVSVTIERPA